MPLREFFGGSFEQRDLEATADALGPMELFSWAGTYQNDDGKRRAQGISWETVCLTGGSILHGGGSIKFSSK